MSKQSYMLVSHRLCPFVQRVAITLAEKGIAFDREDIDLSAKPDWLLKVSPTGTVPLLRLAAPHQHVILRESVAICEYLEDANPERALHPADPIARAQGRALFDVATQCADAAWHAVTATDAGRFETARDDLFRRLEGLGEGKEPGPFFHGEAFGFVDAFFAPVFRLLEEAQTGRTDAMLSSHPRLDDWRRALRSRASVAGAVPADFGERLRGHLQRIGAIVTQSPVVGKPFAGNAIAANPGR